MEGFIYFLIGQHNLFDFRIKPGWQDSYLISSLKNSTRYSTSKSSKVMILIGMRTDNPLNGKTGIDMIEVGPDIDIFEMVEQRGALIPGHILRSVYHIIPLESGYRDKGNIRNIF